jgi:hypothetical protein
LSLFVDAVVVAKTVEVVISADCGVVVDVVVVVVEFTNWNGLLSPMMLGPFAALTHLTTLTFTPSLTHWHTPFASTQG